MTSVCASIRWNPARIRPTVSASRPFWAMLVWPKTSRRRSTSAALWQAMMTSSPPEAASSSALTLASSPENRSMLSIRRWQVASSESADERRQGDRRPLDQAGERRLDREQPRGVLRAAEVVLRLVLEVGRLDQRHPRPGGQGVGGVAEGGRVVAVERGEGGQVDPVELAERALRVGVEGADRLDLVAEELDADGVARVGREDVEDPAAEAELPRDLDHLDPVHPLADQPARQVLHLDRVAHPDRPGRLRQRLGGRDRLQERLDRRDDEPRRVRAPEGLDHPQPPAEDLVPRPGLLRELLPGGKTSGITPAKVATSSRKSSTSATCAMTISNVRGACRPSPAAVSGPADPQAPSMVALRLFLSAARTSGNPGARWICRVSSCNSRLDGGAGSRRRA